MRDVLSQLLVESAAADDRFVVLSGDHGYALFDALRAEHASQFVNVGVAEQNMIGLAAGLARTGFRPCVYGLAAFVPMRVVEQIKLDLCHAKLPTILLGDGAGLVYSTLGVSHQCGEDVACLRTLPHVAVYAPCDAVELRACWAEARAAAVPCYIRLGKADRPAVHTTPLPTTEPVAVHRGAAELGDRLIIASGAMVAPAAEFARRHDVSCLSVPRIKPFPVSLATHLQGVRRIAVVEEHVRSGGVWAALVEHLAQHRDAREAHRDIEFMGLRTEFTATAGTYQHALSEHGLSDPEVHARLGQWLGTSQPRPIRRDSI